MIHEEGLMAVVGEMALARAEAKEALRSPGLLRKHYAPKAKLLIWSWADEAELRRKIADCSRRAGPIAGCHVITHTNIPGARRFGRVSVIPRDARAFARAIYAELHQCDE